MEELKTFLQSDMGPVVCSFLIFVGISSAIITKILFGKKIITLEETLKPTLSPDQKKPIQTQIDNFKMIVNMQIMSGVLFVAMGVIGLTYKF